MTCFLSFLLLFLLSVLHCQVERPVSAAIRPELILTPEQQSQAGRLSAVYFLSACLSRPQDQDATSHGALLAQSFHPPFLFFLNEWIISCLSLFTFLFFYLSSMMLNLGVATFCVIQASTNEFLFSISYCFFILRRHHCVWVCGD